jgi:hypothetical protein
MLYAIEQRARPVGQRQGMQSCNQVLSFIQMSGRDVKEMAIRILSAFPSKRFKPEVQFIVINGADISFGDKNDVVCLVILELDPFISYCFYAPFIGGNRGELALGIDLVWYRQELYFRADL